MSLTGKVAIITGACSGIGAATAELFASEGCFLSITGLDKEGLDKTKLNCLMNGLLGSQLLLSVGDVRDDGFLRSLVNNTVDNFSKIDILINNAGIAVIQSVMEMPLETMNEIFSINLMAPIMLIKLCAPYLKQTNGNIVNTSSISALFPYNAAPIYGTSKAALKYITECLVLELSPEVRINCVMPGLTNTQIHIRNEVDNESADLKMEQVQARARKMTSLGRIAEPKEIAAAILFLAGDNAKYITGEGLVVDGGYLCRRLNINRSKY